MSDAYAEAIGAKGGKSDYAEFRDEFDALIEQARSEGHLADIWDYISMKHEEWMETQSAARVRR